MTDPTALALRIFMTSGAEIEVTVSGKDYGQLVEVIEFPVTRGGLWCALDLETREVILLRAAEVAAVTSGKPSTTGRTVYSYGPDGEIKEDGNV